MKLELGPMGATLMFLVFVGFYCDFVQSEEEDIKAEKSVCDSGVKLCDNGGRCIPNKSKRGYRCKCPDKYVGDKCQQVDYCRFLPCKNKGECINRRYGYRCRCERPYYGKNCDIIRVNYCDSLPCKHGGECVNKDNGFNCKCPPEYTGDFCEEESGLKEKCQNITEHLSRRCCKVLNRCCLTEPREFVCGTWPDGKNPVMYYNKCELRKARCLDLDQCILKREMSNCEGDHVTMMTRPTPCDECPCQGMVVANQSLQDIARMHAPGETLNENNCTVNCDTAPPEVPFCLKEASENLKTKSIWDTL